MLPQLDPITVEILKLAELLAPVETENVPLEQAAGRVLGEALLADRDSPALNVSAMDGYALRLDEARSRQRWPVTGIATAGSPPTSLPLASAIKIFTGAAVPPEADCVVPRELTREEAEAVELTVPARQLTSGMNIRRQGENARRGSQVLAAGHWLSPAAMAGVASVAGPTVRTRRRVRVAILNTGDELVPPGQPVADWQIRDSNGPTLIAMLAQHRWLEIITRQKVNDDFASVVAALESCQSADAVVLTGGVSMGDTDHVPRAVERVGSRILFHRLPLRPGKPVLGALRQQQLIVGLPGNPVSVAVTARVIALPLLRRLGGFSQLIPTHPPAPVANSDDRTLQLQWYRLVQLGEDGQVQYLDHRGSGDLIALARSSGFVKLPIGASGPGPWELTLW